jgi:hypothetical protein
MQKGKASIKVQKTNNQSGCDWTRTTNEWQREQFVLIREKRVYQQKSGRCGYLKSGKRFHNLVRDRCVQRDKASFDRSNESAPHIRDMVGNLLKRLLNSFVAQSLIELIKALME